MYIIHMYIYIYICIHTYKLIICIYIYTSYICVYIYIYIIYIHISRPAFLGSAKTPAPFPKHESSNSKPYQRKLEEGQGFGALGFRVWGFGGLGFRGFGVSGFRGLGVSGFGGLGVSGFGDLGYEALRTKQWPGGAPEQ